MSDDAKAEAVVAEMNAAEDDFTHYFNATGRLSRENADLRARLAEVEAERDRTAAMHEASCASAREFWQRAEAAEDRLAAAWQDGWDARDEGCPGGYALRPEDDQNPYLRGEGDRG